MKQFFVIMAAMLAMAVADAHAAPVGSWKAYMAYHDITNVAKGGHTLFVLASGNLFSYNENDHSLTTYDKVNGLSDCNITLMGWNRTARRLLVVYENQNIDLVDEGGNVTNIAALKNYTTTSSKTVNSIAMNGKYAYLSIGFGIICINVANAEIVNTYNLGFNVDWTSVNGNTINAFSRTKGHFQGNTTTNLLDKDNWKWVGDYEEQPAENNDSLMARARTLAPGGPRHNGFGFLKLYQGRLYSCGGGYTLVQDFNRPATIQVLDPKTDEWTFFQDSLENITGVPFIDMNCLDFDPRNAGHVFAGGRTGLYEFQNGSFVKYYDYENSLVRPVFPNDKNYQPVMGLKYDTQGNLWMLNSITTEQNLMVRGYDGTWTAHFSPKLQNEYQNTLMGMANLGKMMFDSRGLLWFVNDNWIMPGLFAFQPSTNALNAYTSFTNEDGMSLTLNNVRCVAEDQNNDLWVGTSVGPLVLHPNQITAENPYFDQIKVPRNDGTNLADYLLAGIDITCIVIDGANRKWMGTNNNGLYLISEDNYTQVEHFLASNSPLLSDNIESLAIDPLTGQLFIGTDRGLCSYMTDATAPADEMNKDNTYAYPNPVKPDYRGMITIVGLTYNADVKIVTASGTLVNEGKSNGGTYQWDGCDLKGRRVASGVYMVETATRDGEKGTVCKIAVVN